MNYLTFKIYQVKCSRVSNNVSNNDNISVINNIINLIGLIYIYGHGV